MKSTRIPLSIAVILTVLSLCISFSAGAQTQVSPERCGEMIDSITSRWLPWNSVSISGKLKMAGLPVSPSMKIYMKRDSALFISLRAPFMGEVGRAEILGDTIMVVNKMKKTYVKESIEKALDHYPGGLADLQDLILGRIVIPGKGLLESGHSPQLEIYEGEDGMASIMPAESLMLPDFNYGYVVDADWQTNALLVIPLSKQATVVSLTYEYFPDGYNIEFLYQSEKKNYRALLELDEPQWEAEGFSPIHISSKFKRLPLDEFIKSF